MRLGIAEDGAERDLELENDFVFVFAGGTPPFPLLKEAGIRFPEASGAR